MVLRTGKTSGNQHFGGHQPAYNNLELIAVGADGETMSPGQFFSAVSGPVGQKSSSGSHGPKKFSATTVLLAGFVVVVIGGIIVAGITSSGAFNGGGQGNGIPLTGTSIPTSQNHARSTPSSSPSSSPIHTSQTSTLNSTITHTPTNTPSPTSGGYLFSGLQVNAGDITCDLGTRPGQSHLEIAPGSCLSRDSSPVSGLEMYIGWMWVVFYDQHHNVMTGISPFAGDVFQDHALQPITIEDKGYMKATVSGARGTINYYAVQLSDGRVVLIEATNVGKYVPPTRVPTQQVTPQPTNDQGGPDPTPKPTNEVPPTPIVTVQP